MFKKNGETANQTISSDGVIIEIFLDALVDYGLFRSVNGAGKNIFMILCCSFVCHSRIRIFCIIHFIWKTDISIPVFKTDSTLLQMRLASVDKELSLDIARKEDAV